MDLIISEVQITCIILMGLTTIFLMAILPRLVVSDRIFGTARKLLSIGTLLVSLHFMVQYVLHKHTQEVEPVRSLVNLSFGIPISYLVNLSYLYLQRQGRIRKSEWWAGPVIMGVALALFAVAQLTQGSYEGLPLKGISACYGISLLYYNCKQLKEYLHIRKDIRDRRNMALKPLVKFTRLSMWLMMTVALGFPVMTFNSHTMMRSVYGLLAISTAFFYTLCFIAYGLRLNLDELRAADGTEKPDNDGRTERMLWNESKQKRMEKASVEFVKSERYMHLGITLGDAADYMGVSCNMLKEWLHRTDYEKFNNWINVLRIGKAKELMESNREMSQEEIAEKCGFCDRQYFSRQFSRIEGMSPSRWMKDRSEQQAQEGSQPVHSEPAVTER